MYLPPVCLVPVKVRTRDWSPFQEVLLIADASLQVLATTILKHTWCSVGTRMDCFPAVCLTENTSSRSPLLVCDSEVLPIGLCVECLFLRW